MTLPKFPREVRDALIEAYVHLRVFPDRKRRWWE